MFNQVQMRREIRFRRDKGFHQWVRSVRAYFGANQSQALRYPMDMRIDRKGRLAKGKA